MTTYTPSKLHALATRALIDAGASLENAGLVADALIAAEIDGISSHGLSRLPAYADQLASGKIDGTASPDVKQTAAAVVSVDARYGFAFPAIEAGIKTALPIVRETGVAAVAIRNSHHCGMLGHTVESVARHNVLALAFSNTPAAIAPWGGTRGVFGTNPVALGCPRRDLQPLVIDLAISVVARGKIMQAANRNESIPEGWALDASGKPTTDPRKALAGTMVPIGGAKGAALALMVELLAAALTRSHFGFEASSFFDAKGEPPGIGQLFLMFDVRAFGGDAVLERIETLCQAIEEDSGARLPGARRFANRVKIAESGIAIPDPLYQDLLKRAHVSSPDSLASDPKLP
ncbi:MAG TPA: Ldh family oxidoreductase [Candidatus Dormibacteraeota bacterium]|nr:Ldh family oxidoreductase [Candidatus Dormibacteraeota bacterium]